MSDQPLGVQCLTCVCFAMVVNQTQGLWCSFRVSEVLYWPMFSVSQKNTNISVRLCGGVKWISLGQSTSSTLYSERKLIIDMGWRYISKCQLANGGLPWQDMDQSVDERVIHLRTHTEDNEFSWNTNHVYGLCPLVHDVKTEWLSSA